MKQDYQFQRPPKLLMACSTPIAADSGVCSCLLIRYVFQLDGDKIALLEIKS
jgi:hypothetical protein